MILKRFLRTLAIGLAASSMATSASAQSLKAQFRPTWISTGDNQLALVLNIVNTGSTTVALNTVTVRYYYTIDGAQAQSVFCDYTPRGCGNVTGTFGTVSPATATADTYLQVAFSSGAGSLSAGQSTGDIQLRVAKTNWANYNETNDYSYAGNTSLTDNANIVVFVSGAAVWGTAPGGGTTADFALSASPASVTVNTGATATSTVSITRTNFTSAVALTASGLPAGVTASFSPASATGTSSVVTFTASSTATTGAANVTITGTGGGLTRTATVALTVSGGTTANFTLAATPSSVTVNRSATATSTLGITRTSFTTAVALSVSGLPAGVTASFNPASTTGSSSTLTFTASSTATLTTATVTVTGTGGGLTRTATISLTVSSGTTANFTLAAAPATLTVNRGASGTSTISITRTSFTTAVALTASGLPTGVTASFNPASATGASSIVTLAASSTATTGGPVTVTITGTGGGLTRTTTIALTVGGGTGGTGNFTVVNGRIRKDGAAFPVRCGSWFGVQGRYEIATDSANPRGAPMEQYVGNTFWASDHSRTVAQTMNEIKAAGITVIRLPVVHQTLSGTDPQGNGSLYKNYSGVINDATYPLRNSRESMESMIKAANAVGIAVLLDIHSCSNYVDWRKGRLDARPPWVDATRDNYDYKREDCSCAATNNPSTVTRIQAYNESIWLEDLRALARLPQSLGVSNIIGIDIFNEPHDYTWTEWKTLTEHAYQAISAVNSNLLVFVQGIGTTAGTQDGTPTTTTPTPHGAAETNPNWGENLFSAGDDPPAVPMSKLVFSPHTYGPSVFPQKMFMDPAQPECVGLEGDAAGDAKCQMVINPTLLRSGWEEHFGYLKDLGYAVVVGEFGGNLDWPLGQASIRDRNRFSYLTDKTVDAKWQNAFVDYLVSRGIEGCYWSINPESGDTGGWYGHAYDPISNTGGWGAWLPFESRKTTLLNRLWSGVP
jgi:aryl-phospho-beta-D-glucosidase BglC (GH1 family)